MGGLDVASCLDEWEEREEWVELERERRCSVRLLDELQCPGDVEEGRQRLGRRAEEWGSGAGLEPVAACWLC